MSANKMQDKINSVMTISTIAEARTAAKNFGIESAGKTLTELKTEMVTAIANSYRVSGAPDNTELVNSAEASAKLILEEAEELDEKLKDMPVDEREIYFNEVLSKKSTEIAELFKKVFPEFTTHKEYRNAIAADKDLPASAILTNFSIRIVTQQIGDRLEEYGLGSLLNTEMVRNGVKEKFYRDFKATDSKSGYSDVEISDFNAGYNKSYSKKWQVDTEIHAGYDIINSMLNDVTLTPGLFVALVSDYAYNISKPIANKIFRELIKFIEDDTNYDKVGAFAGADAKERAKELSLRIKKLKTTSRNHLSTKFDGKALEYRQRPEETTLIINTKYSADYNYDLVANTFQMGAITMQVGNIIEVDFDELKQYAPDPTTTKIGDIDVLIWTNGAANQFYHYQGTTLMPTPKLKSVFHYFARYGMMKDPNKYLEKFNKHVVVK